MLVIDPRDAGAFPPWLAAEAEHFDGDLRWLGVLARHGIDSALLPELWVERSDRGASLLPVLRQGRRGRALSSFYTARYEPRIDPAAPEGLTRILSALRTESGLSRLELRPLERSSAAYPATLEALRRAGWRAHEYFCFGNWYLPVDGRDYAELEAHLPGQVRSTLKRKGRRFESAGGRLEILLGPEAARQATEAFQRVYAESWKRPEPYPDFMPELIALCAREGWMRMGVAWLGEQPVAAQLWIVYRGVAAIYKLAYDEGYPQFSAGTLLTALLMRRVIDEDRVEVVDYLVGDEPYKQDWMSHRRERWGIVAFNPATADGMLGWLAESARRVVRRATRGDAPR